MNRQIAIQALATQVASVHSNLVSWRAEGRGPQTGSDIVRALLDHLEGRPSPIHVLRHGATLYTARIQLEVFRDIGLWDGSQRHPDRPRRRSRVWPAEDMQIREFRKVDLLAPDSGPEESILEARQYAHWLRRQRRQTRRENLGTGRQPVLFPLTSGGQNAPVRRDALDGRDVLLDPRQCKPRRHLLGRPSIEPAARFHTSLPTQFRLTLQARVQKTTSDPLNRFLAYLWAYAFTQDGRVLPVMARKLHAFRLGAPTADGSGGRHWFDVHVPARSNSELVHLPTWP